MGRGRPKEGLINKPVKKTISRQDRKGLKILAGDFGLLHRPDVQEIVENCKTYSEGQQKIMRVYDAVYM